MSTPDPVAGGGRAERRTVAAMAGKAAHSPFRLAKLLGEVRAIEPSVTGLESWFVYWLALAREPDDGERGRLRSLLNDGDEAAPPPAGELVHVVPRIGTISPWSSKATDIAHACGLDVVERIERGVVWRLAGAGHDPARLAAAGAPLADRMIESLFAGDFDGAALFETRDPAPLVTIPLDGDAGATLAAADRELGLALSPDEIDYLVENYRALGRAPTDAELMMFAQANSEHCRHKIFNADWILDGERRQETLFGMIRHTTAAAPEGVISAYRDNAAVIAGWRGERVFPDPDTRVYGEHAEPIHILMKVETHNHPTAISPFPGAATGAGGEIRDEGATGLGARPKAGLTGFSVSHLRIPGFEQPWEVSGAISRKVSRETSAETSWNTAAEASVETGGGAAGPAPFGHPARLATPLQIMIEGPIGGAAFNNEFGRPNLAGYFRTFEMSLPWLPAGEIRGYHKPIMVAGGLGNVREAHAVKGEVPAGTRLIVLGGPAMQIGLGGGAASSLTSGASTEDLDFASVQRGNPEIQRRAQEVIDRCWALGDANPLLLVHDVGAGGLSNAVPEAVDHSKRGGRFELRRVPNAEPGMSPMAIWCNEAQERYVLVVAPERLADFDGIARRERCPYAVLGEITDDGRLVVTDEHFGNTPVELPLTMLLGKPPKMTREAERRALETPAFDFDGIELREACKRVLQHPAVADKSFLIHIGDRTVGGLTARDQMVGPWQVPVSDVAVTTSSYSGYTGEAMAMGERTPVAVLDAPASGRLAVAEAVTNIVAADIGEIGAIRLSANWMAAAGHPGEDAALFDTVKAVATELCPALGIAIPVGKDSLSMKTAWTAPDGAREVVAPVSLIVSAFAPVADVRRTLTPELKPVAGGSTLLAIELGADPGGLGGSCLAQVYSRPGGAPPDLDDPARLGRFVAAIRALAREDLLLAYHDRSDGGLFATVAEMMFAGRQSVSIALPFAGPRLTTALFAEDPGAVVQIADSDLDRAMAVFADHDLGAHVNRIGRVLEGEGGATDAETGHSGERDGRRRTDPRAGDQRLVIAGDGEDHEFGRRELQRWWSETSYRIRTLRDNPASALEEREAVDDDDPGLNVRLSFDPREDVAAPFVARRARPRIAVLREQGVNSQTEMAAAFLRAGFEAVDVHMSDLLDGRDELSRYQGLVACGGFSFGDVLGAGGGWAKSILFHRRLEQQFAAFFARGDSFALGVCNGCQMLSGLKSLIPGAESWPAFLRNRSEQFEARLSLVEVAGSPSIFFDGMRGSRMPIATSHGEGRAQFEDERALRRCETEGLVAVRYVDNRGAPTERYPANPNGSAGGICALTVPDGRVTVIMPHPERVRRTVQCSWHPGDWGEDSPWMRMFRNARVAVG